MVVIMVIRRLLEEPATEFWAALAATSNHCKEGDGKEYDEDAKQIIDAKAQIVVIRSLVIGAAVRELVSEMFKKAVILVLVHELDDVVAICKHKCAADGNSHHRV